MEIMKLSSVPELEEFSGTEKIYVNDNGKTKQIACDKVVTGNGGGGRIYVKRSSEQPEISPEELVTAIEEGKEIWYTNGSEVSKIIGFNWSSSTGSITFITGSYVIASGYHGSSSATVESVLLCGFSTYDYPDLLDRLYAAFGQE